MDDAEQTKCQSVILSHEYMYRDVYDTHRLRVINDAQLITESITDDALLQAMPHIKHALIRFFGVMKFCVVESLPYFNQILWSSGFETGLLGACDIDIHSFNRDTSSVKALSSSLKIILAKTIVCHSR